MALSSPVNPRVFSQVIEGGAAFGSNLLNFAPAVAVSLHITNEGINDLQVRLNGDDNAVFTLYETSGIQFHCGDLHITSIDFQNVQSGASDCATQVIVGLVEC